MMRRPRRNRKSSPVRGMVRETHLNLDQLVYPLFITSESESEAIDSLPGQYRFSTDDAMKEIGDCLKLGLRNFIVFPVVPEELKDATASYSLDSDNFYLQFASEAKEKYGDEISLTSDVALDPYSSDGHDGVYRDGVILNDESLPILAKMAAAQAEAGFDYIGPSDMMDGRIEAIRMELDSEGYSEVGIMSYTAKYASGFYGPFRDALDSAPKNGDKKTYQMDPANRREARLEAQLDLSEGADILMVKPALPYMDVIQELKVSTDIPIACYHVSGEYAMLKAASANGWLDYNTVMPETLLSLRRAGADIIITYSAKEYAELMQDQK